MKLEVGKTHYVLFVTPNGGVVAGRYWNGCFECQIASETIMRFSESDIKEWIYARDAWPQTLWQNIRTFREKTGGGLGPEDFENDSERHEEETPLP